MTCMCFKYTWKRSDLGTRLMPVRAMRIMTSFIYLGLGKHLEKRNNLLCGCCFRLLSSHDLHVLQVHVEEV